MVTIGLSSCEKQLAVLFNTKHSHIIRNYDIHFLSSSMYWRVHQAADARQATAIDTYALRAADAYTAHANAPESEGREEIEEESERAATAEHLRRAQNAIHVWEIANGGKIPIVVSASVRSFDSSESRAINANHLLCFTTAGLACMHARAFLLSRNSIIRIEQRKKVEIKFEYVFIKAKDGMRVVVQRQYAGLRWKPRRMNRSDSEKF